eukprot:5890476-Prymnesium_polylepis.1
MAAHLGPSLQGQPKGTLSLCAGRRAAHLVPLARDAAESAVRVHEAPRPKRAVHHLIAAASGASSVHHQFIISSSSVHHQFIARTASAHHMIVAAR